MCTLCEFHYDFDEFFVHEMIIKRELRCYLIRFWNQYKCNILLKNAIICDDCTFVHIDLNIFLNNNLISSFLIWNKSMLFCIVRFQIWTKTNSIHDEINDWYFLQFFLFRYHDKFIWIVEFWNEMRHLKLQNLM